jgi:hypothetical protein
VANRPIYVALVVTVEGHRDILGLWAGEHGDGEGAKYWMRVLAKIKNRGTRDCLIVVCDGLKGLPEAIAAVWPQTIVQTCIVHLLRNSFKYASKKDWAAVARDLKPVYTAVSESAALDAFAEFSETWEKKYPAIIRLWTHAWAEFVPFLRFDREIRTIICTTNAIESINARIRRAVNARGHFPTEAAALKCVYLAIMSLDPTGKGTATLVQPMESRPQRLRDHLRRTPVGLTEVTPKRSSYTVKLTDPLTAMTSGYQAAGSVLLLDSEVGSGWGSGGSVAECSASSTRETPDRRALHRVWDGTGVVLSRRCCPCRATEIT